MTKPSGGQAAKAAKWASQKHGPLSVAAARESRRRRRSTTRLIKKARWRGTEPIARETPAGSASIVTMPHRKDFASDKEHQVKFNLWLKTGDFKGKVLK